MRRAILAATLTCLALATPVLAQEEAIMSQIEKVQGDSVGFGEAFGKLQDGFLFDTAAENLADLAAYPLDVMVDGTVVSVADADELVEDFDTLVSQDTQAALARQDFSDLIVTSEGVGFANGALWMANICTDDSCDETYWAITRINN